MKRLTAGLALALAGSTLLGAPAAEARNATPGCVGSAEWEAIHPTTWRHPGPYTRARVERIFGEHGTFASGGSGAYTISYTMCRSNHAQATVSYQNDARGRVWAFAKKWNADSSSPNGVTVQEFVAVGYWTGTWYNLPNDSGLITGGPTRRQVDTWFDVPGEHYSGAWYWYPAARQSEWNRYGGTHEDEQYNVWLRYSADGHLTRMAAAPADD
jgi:hypothetical protein